MAAAAVLMACAREPVTWDAETFEPGSVVEEPFPSVARSRASIPSDSASCPASMRYARSGKIYFAAWWSVRADSSSVLRVSKSIDGALWGPAATVDAGDRSRIGCARPAPAVFADFTSGYLHLVYFMEPAEGPGVFFSHSMDGGVTFHAPVALVYGRTPSNASVAGQGNRIVAAFEDPNAARPGIILALSKSMGHIFEQRSQASGDQAVASEPAVRLRGRTVEVTWRERLRADSAATRRVMRKGTWE